MLNLLFGPCGRHNFLTRAPVDWLCVVVVESGWFHETRRLAPTLLILRRAVLSAFYPVFKEPGFPWGFAPYPSSLHSLGPPASLRSARGRLRRLGDPLATTIRLRVRPSSGEPYNLTTGRSFCQPPPLDSCNKRRAIEPVFSTTFCRGIGCPGAPFDVPVRSLSRPRTTDITRTSEPCQHPHTRFFTYRRAQNATVPKLLIR